MKATRFVFLLLLFSCLVTFSASSPGYELRTHGEITSRAFDRSLNTKGYLEGLHVKQTDVFDFANRTLAAQLGNFLNNATPKGWMIEGSIREDDFRSHPTCPQPKNPSTSVDRPIHHFFDVQRGEGGLNTLLITGFPAADWALGQQGRSQNEFTILDARNYQLRSLTDSSKEDRDQNTARLFRTLGHVVHLVQDMAQPQHTRNDAHSGCVGGFLGAGEHSWYENYVEKHVLGARYRERSNPPPSLFLTNYDPPRFSIYRHFWASPQQSGVANFSSQNFFSAGTNLSRNDCGGLLQPTCNNSVYQEKPETFSYRTIDDKVISGEVTLYLSDVTDQHTSTTYSGVALSSRSFWDQHLENSNSLFKSFTLNTINYEHMSALLLPRAVGYSTGLLDHFFRGDLVLGLVQDDNDPSIVRIEGRNKSPERLDGGELLLYADDVQGNRTVLQALDSNLTIVADPGQPVKSGRFQLPASAEKFVAVYKGKLGEEMAAADSPGAVIGRAVEGVIVEQLYRDSTRWYIRTAEGILPTEILTQNVQDLQWGDSDNTLVGRSQIGPGQPNTLYAYEINRPSKATHVPLRPLTEPLPDQPEANQIVDLLLQQQIPFPFGIDVGTQIVYSDTVDFKQHILSMIETRTLRWEETTHQYRETGPPEFSDFNGNLVTADTKTLNRTYSVVLNPEHFSSLGRPYIANLGEISLTSDGRILLILRIGLSFPEESTTVEVFKIVPPPAAFDNGKLPPQIVADDPFTINYDFPRNAINPTFWAVLDVTNGIVVASTAPPVVTLNYKRNITLGNRRPLEVSFLLGRILVRNNYIDGARDGEFSYLPSVNEAQMNFGACPSQMSDFVSQGSITAQTGNMEINLARFKPELIQLPATSTIMVTTVDQRPFGCGDPSRGIPPQGFTISRSNAQIGTTNNFQMTRAKPGTHPDQYVIPLVLFNPASRMSTFKYTQWEPDSSGAVVRQTFTGPDDYILLGASRSSLLVQSSIADNFFDNGPKILIPLDDVNAATVMTGIEENEIHLLDPDYLYDANALKFFTKESVPELLSLPKALTNAPSGNPRGRYHLLRISGVLN